MTFGETKGSGDAGVEGGCWPGPSAASRAPGRKEFLASLLPFHANSPNLGAGVATLQTTANREHTTLIREKGSAISVFPIAAFLYRRGHVGPSLSASGCRKQTGCAERDSGSFRSSCPWVLLWGQPLPWVLLAAPRLNPSNSGLL